MMHEIAVSCVNVTKPVRFGLTKVDQRMNESCIDKIVHSCQSSTCTSLTSITDRA